MLWEKEVHVRRYSSFAVEYWILRVFNRSVLCCDVVIMQTQLAGLKVHHNPGPVLSFSLRLQCSNCSRMLWGKLLWWFFWIWILGIVLGHPITHFKWCAFEVKSDAIPQLAKAYSMSFAVAMSMVTLFSYNAVLYLCNCWRTFVSSLQAQGFGVEVNWILGVAINSFRTSVSSIFETMGVTIHAWLNHYVRMYMLLKDFGLKWLLVEWVQFFLPTCSLSAEEWMGKNLAFYFIKKCWTCLIVKKLQISTVLIGMKNVHCWSCTNMYLCSVVVGFAVTAGMPYVFMVVAALPPSL